jgi:hypothetical protein
MMHCIQARTLFQQAQHSLLQPTVLCTATDRCAETNACLQGLQARLAAMSEQQLRQKLVQLMARLGPMQAEIKVRATAAYVCS